MAEAAKDGPLDRSGIRVVDAVPGPERPCFANVAASAQPDDGQAVPLRDVSW